MGRAARMYSALEGKTDARAARKRALLADMMRRAGAQLDIPGPSRW